MNREAMTLMALTVAVAASLMTAFYFGGAANCAKCGKRESGFQVRSVVTKSMNLRFCDDCLERIVSEGMDEVRD